MDLRLENITKHFNSFVANKNINLTVNTGKTKGILGENGAGKTTLMNIISGLYQPDNGQIYLNNKPVKITSSQVAIQLGIGMVHQHFRLVPKLTVTENIILGTETSWYLNQRKKQQEIAALSQAYNLDIDPTEKIENLPVGTQQRVEILKALYRQAQLLILDEPTAVLTPTEVDLLINTLRQLAGAGKTILFISHKLQEIINLCDTVTVLRRGEVVATTPTKEVTPEQLSQLMIGRSITLPVNQSVSVTQQIILSVQNLEVIDDRGIPAIKNLSFQLHSGEILGVAGVDENGQRELADAIASIRPINKGKIEFKNSSKDIGYIPEDRQKMGLVLQFNIAQNLILKRFKTLPFCRHFILQSLAIKNHAQDLIEAFDIRASKENILVSQLSGGNQQKIVLAREIAAQPHIIIAMQPTRGLDIGATVAIHSQLLAQRDRGAAILYISTELEEIMTLSDRIAVIYKGEFIAILEAQTATREEIGLLMGGGGNREEGIGQRGKGKG